MNTETEKGKDVKYDMDSEMMKIDGFDDCIVGVATRICMKDSLCYSFEKIIAKLMERDGMTHDEAVEYAEFNIAGAYFGGTTPILLRDVDLFDLDLNT